MTAATTQHSPDVPTWRCSRAWVALIATMLLSFSVDLVTKWLAFRNVADLPVTVRREDVLQGGSLYRLIPVHEPVVVVPKLLEFTLVLNPGAVFGMGPGNRWFFVCFTIGAIAFAVWLFATWSRSTDRAVHIALGMLLGGGLGNLYDRLAFACVRDFIHPLPRMKLPFGWSYPWVSGPGAHEIWPYVSNVADLLLIIGIAILVIRTWNRSGPVRARTATPAG